MILSPTFWPSSVAVLAYALAALWPARAEDASAAPARPTLSAHAVRIALWLGWLAQGAAIALDVLSLDSPLPGARFGFAPALSVTAWLDRSAAIVVLVVLAIVFDFGVQAALVRPDHIIYGAAADASGAERVLAAFAASPARHTEHCNRP